MRLDTEQTREFVGLIVRHQTQLRAYIISLMPGTPGVSDVLQETNLVLWEKMNSFELGTNFTAWAFSVARYEVLAHCRKLHRLDSVLADSELAEQVAEQIGTDFEPGDEVMERRIAALEKCLSALSVEERELVRKRYEDGSSLATFARQTGRSDSSLRTSLQRLRAGLRKCISARIAMASHQA